MPVLFDRRTSSPQRTRLHFAWLFFGRFCDITLHVADVYAMVAEEDVPESAWGSAAFHHGVPTIPA
jgi:hypothetical protein